MSIFTGSILLPAFLTLSSSYEIVHNFSTVIGIHPTNQVLANLKNMI